MEIILTARSGRHAVKNAIANIGFQEFSQEEFERIFTKFIELADAKKEVYNHDLYHIVESTINITEENDENSIKVKDQLYELIDIQVISNNIFPSASVKIKKGHEEFKSSSIGDGAIDALYTAIKKSIGMEIDLLEYKISSISRGKEALGRVSILVCYKNKNYASKVIDTDIMKASALAFINAANMIIIDEIINSPRTSF